MCRCDQSQEGLEVSPFSLSLEPREWLFSLCQGGPVYVCMHICEAMCVCVCM